MSVANFYMPIHKINSHQVNKNLYFSSLDHKLFFFYNKFKKILLILVHVCMYA
jgi:hypothetical protein